MGEGRAAAAARAATRRDSVRAAWAPAAEVACTLAPVTGGRPTAPLLSPCRPHRGDSGSIQPGVLRPRGAVPQEDQLAKALSRRWPHAHPLHRSWSFQYASKLICCLRRVKAWRLRAGATSAWRRWRGGRFLLGSQSVQGPFTHLSSSAPILWRLSGTPDGLASPSHGRLSRLHARPRRG